MEIGKKAPGFNLPASNGEEISLEQFKGDKNVVLYFYPKDNTPGWITEASEFRDNKKKFEDLNTVILGVSPDTMESHHKFIDKQGINFILLSDREKKVIELYGVAKAIGLERSTFIIDKAGNLVKEYRKVKPKGHAEEVLNYIRNNQ